MIDDTLYCRLTDTVSMHKTKNQIVKEKWIIFWYTKGHWNSAMFRYYFIHIICLRQNCFYSVDV